MADAVCECGALIDTRGRHRAACPHPGRLRTRAVAPERTLARICREAGATVRSNVKLRDMNVHVRADDERCIEVLASGLPLFHGAQLAVDITLRCALTCGGDPRPGAARVDGIVCNTARAEKERTYRELTARDTCHTGSVSISGLAETMVPHDLHFLCEGVRHVTLGGAERLARCGWGGRGVS